MRSSARSDEQYDAAVPLLAPVAIVFVAPVGHEPARPLARPANLACDERDAVDERKQLGEVVVVPACQSDRRWHSGGVHQQVVLAAGATRSAGKGPVRPP